MGMMTRMLRLWKADLHGVMDQIEDKRLLMKQYLREMETSLLQKEHRCDQLNRSRQQIRRDMEHRREETGKLEKDLDLAVSKDRDDIARMLIRRRRNLQTACGNLQIQLDELDAEHQNIEKALEEQRLQYSELKVRVDTRLCHEQVRQYNEQSTGFQPFGDLHSPTEEEIELELMQRKEALARGGAE